MPTTLDPVAADAAVLDYLSIFGGPSDEREREGWEREVGERLGEGVDANNFGSSCCGRALMMTIEHF